MPTESDDLATKYRPQNFDDVIGQDEVISSLKALKSLPAAILMSGPSGCGKTTLGRLLAQTARRSVIEVNASNWTGVDDVRILVDRVSYRPFDSDGYVVILDEAQRLSTQAQDALLKPIEDPPPNVSWIFCSTEPTKIKKTIITRCHHYQIKPVSSSVLLSLLGTVAKKENIGLSKPLLSLIVHQSFGSPRQALVFLSMCRNATSDKEVMRLTKSVNEPSPVVLELCRALVQSQSWDNIVSCIDKVRDEELETVRLAVLGYATSVILRSQGHDNDKAMRMLSLINAFSTQFYPSEKLAPLILASGKYFFS